MYNDFMLTKEELAKQLNGVSYSSASDTISTLSKTPAVRESQLIIVYGMSDDLIEVDGYIFDELYFTENEPIYIKDGKVCLEDHQCECEYCTFKKDIKKYPKILAKWCDTSDEYSWTFETTIPHATFDILDAGEKYCRGLVIDAKDLLK